MTEAAKLTQLREELERRFNDEELRPFVRTWGSNTGDLLPGPGRQGALTGILYGPAGGLTN